MVPRAGSLHKQRKGMWGQSVVVGKREVSRDIVLQLVMSMELLENPRHHEGRITEQPQ